MTYVFNEEQTEVKRISNYLSSYDYCPPVSPKYVPLDYKEEKRLTLEDETIDDEEWESDSSTDLLSVDVDEIYKLVVSKDCIVNLSSDNKLRPKIALAIVPNRGRFIENPKDIIYQVFNAEVPIALIGSRVGESVKFRNTTYTIESISYYNSGKSSTSNNVVY